MPPKFSQPSFPLLGAPTVVNNYYGSNVNNNASPPQPMPMMPTYSMGACRPFC